MRSFYLDSNSGLGLFEKVRRKQQHSFIPDEYRQLIKSASTKSGVCVNIETVFYNFEELPGKLRLFKKQKNTLNQKSIKKQC